jgi:hypothetical protein
MSYSRKQLSRITFLGKYSGCTPKTKIYRFCYIVYEKSGIRIQISLSATAMMTTMLAVTIVISFVVAILPVQQATAKQCNSDNNKNNNNIDKADTHDTSCTHDQRNSGKHHDRSSTTTKDKTPFRLSLRFP